MGCRNRSSISSIARSDSIGGATPHSHEVNRLFIIVNVPSLAKTNAWTRLPEHWKILCATLGPSPQQRLD